ncbi:MAG TPA: tRNA lysidine(34) synthetase TilS [Pirellulales bacterium]|jgi:tRNA(Ile)-lysidine synthase
MRVLVAVSGGADSVALLRAVVALKTAGGGRLAVAHFNHRLRADAGQDAQFVADLALRLHLECEIGEADTAAAARATGDGLEAAARSERYRFLQAAAERIGARYVVTAHTADDQVETILHRILRGTGIGGLAGMRRSRRLSDAVSLIRPLLGLARVDVLAYLAELGQPYRDDPSNASHAHTRNRIRHSLLPLLAADYNRDVRSALLRLGAAAGDAQRIIDRLVGQLLESAVSFAGRCRASVDCDRLAGEDRHLVRELFVAIWRRQGWPQQAMTFAHWDRLADVALAAPLPPSPIRHGHNLPGAVVAERAGAMISLTSLE